MLARLWRKRRPSPAAERQRDAAAAVAPAWREAPPMELLPPLRPATPSLAFATSLPSRQPALRMLEPLGHDVAADGPGGLLIGVATPLAVAVTADAVTARLASLADLPMRRIEPPGPDAPRRVQTAVPRRVSVPPPIATPVAPETRKPRRIVSLGDPPAEALPLLRRAGEQREPGRPDGATRPLPIEEPIVRATPAPADEAPREDPRGDAVPVPREAARSVRAPRDEVPARSVRAPRDEVPAPSVRASRYEPRAPRKDSPSARADAPTPRAVRPTARPIRDGAPPARAESDPRVTQPPRAVDEPVVRITPRGDEALTQPLRGQDRPAANVRGDEPPAHAADTPQTDVPLRDDATAPPAAERPARPTPPDEPRARTTRPLRGVGEPVARSTPRDEVPATRRPHGDQPPAQPPHAVGRPATQRHEAPPVRDETPPVRDQTPPVRDETPLTPAGELSAAPPTARPAGLGAPLVRRPAPTASRPPLRRPVPVVQRAEARPRRLPATEPAAEKAPRRPAAAHIRTLLGARGLHVQRSSEPVPAEVRTSLEPQLGVDLSGLRVHRGEESTRMAEALDARAYTVGGEVHVPASQGSLSSGTGQALLAHELVHVAQQRKLGPNLPDESSPQGRQLESEARAMEQTWLAPASVAPSVPLLSRPPAPAVSAPAPAIPEPVQAPDAPADAPKSPQAPVPAPAGPDIEQLTATLYDRVRSLLRNELRVDRERAGLFTDVR